MDLRFRCSEQVPFSSTLITMDSRALSKATQIQSLHQTGSVDAYVAEFKSIAGDLGWSDGPLMTPFKKGLRRAIQEPVIMNADYNSLSEIMDAALTIGRRLEDRELETVSVWINLYTTHCPDAII